MRAVAALMVLLAAGVVALAPRGLAELDFLRAEGCHRAGETAKARTACASALRRCPAHAGALALRKILNRESCASGSDSTLLEMHWTIELGFRCLEQGEPEAAEKMFRAALCLGALATPNAAIRTAEEEARAGLDRIAAMLEDR
jgi:hypothetical protein